MIYLFFIIPVLFAIVFVTIHRKDHEWRETVFATLVVCGVSIFIQAGAYSAFALGSTADTEIINGYVIGKSPVHVSCEHQYKCGETCSTDAKGNQTCFPIYCDEHSYDIDWDVKTSIGTITIDRLDDQGLREPPRWAQVKLGEPAAQEHRYMNYILGNKDSLFSKADQQFALKFKDSIPKYPRVYDYYRVSRVLNVSGLGLPTDYWNEYLNNTLKTLGAEKQVNIVWVITSGQPIEYFQGLVYAWSGGKKNDVIVVTDINKDMSINWGKSTSFADGMNNMELHARNGLSLTGKSMGVGVLADVAGNIGKGYNRLPMKEMDYLKWRELKTWEALVIAILGSIPFGVVFFIGWRDVVSSRRFNRRFR